MSEAHKRAYRHPTDKTAYRVNNWHQYDQAWRDRGDVALWLRHKAIDAWKAPKTAKRGGQRVYADMTIETLLMLRLRFSLPLRQIAGFLRSVLTLKEATQERETRLACPLLNRMRELGRSHSYRIS